MTATKLLLIYLLQTFALSGLVSDTEQIDQEEVYCLAKNVYFEARGEGIQGQRAVALVTMNRVKSDDYPDTICEVVKQTAELKYTKKIVCAFSWVCDKNLEIPLTKKDGTENEKVVEQFRIATQVSIEVLNGGVKDITNGATHFVNPNKAQPPWMTKMKQTLKLGNHIFLK